MIDTGIHSRSNLFNCYPEFCADLSCAMMPEFLKLDVHIQCGKFHDFKNFAITNRLDFSTMSTNLSTKALSTLPSNSKETILLQIIGDKPQVFTPKLLKCDEITIPEAIELDDTQSASQ